MTKTPIAVLGIDLGKNSCSLAGLDATGAVVLRRRMTREGVVAFAAKLPTCVVAMEACCGAHYLGRTFEAQGHEVRLMSPEYVAPYVKAHKTDDRDAEAIAEAATRPTMRLVTLKSEAQLDLQVLHRARERLVAGRTRLTNQLRAVLLERGVILPKRRAPLSKRLDELMAGELAISPRALRLLQDLRDEWANLDRRISAYDDELATLTREDETARRLATIPGIRREFHLLTLLSGSRPDALKRTRLEHVDLRRRILHMPNPKGGKKKAFDVPLSRPMVRSIIRAIRAGRVMHPDAAEFWLFAAESGSGHLVEHKEDRALLAKWGNDLRQSYRTLAQPAGVSELDIHLLMNHSLPGVNAGYITRERLLDDHMRKQQEKISAVIVNSVLGSTAPENEGLLRWLSGKSRVELS